jgi:hypothetical protein
MVRQKFFEIFFLRIWADFQVFGVFGTESQNGNLELSIALPSFVVLVGSRLTLNFTSMVQPIINDYGMGFYTTQEAVQLIVQDVSKSYCDYYGTEACPVDVIKGVIEATPYSEELLEEFNKQLA